MTVAIRTSGILAATVATILLSSSCKRPSSEASISLPATTENAEQVLTRVIDTDTLSKNDLAQLAQKARSVDLLTFSVLTKKQAYQLMSLTIEHLNEDENKEGDAIELIRFLQGNCSSGGRTQWRTWFAAIPPEEIGWSIALRDTKHP